MREKPPCKVNGVERKKRYIGCRADCEAYHNWLAAHNAELEARRNHKAKEIDIADVEGKRYLRERLKNRLLRAQERRQLYG